MGENSAELMERARVGAKRGVGKGENCLSVVAKAKDIRHTI
jgi:hypothetical protein